MLFDKFYQEKLTELKSHEVPRPLLDLDLIFCEILKCERHELVSRPDRVLVNDEVKLINLYIGRRCQHEPLAYIFNYKYFYKNKFYVDENVLIPRPETELLVEKAFEVIDENKSYSILDMGAGSGCIGLSMASELKQSTLTAVDICPKALKVVKKNYELLNLKNKFHLANKDISKMDNNNYLNQFDLIFANPPYIDEKKGYVQRSVKDYEPHLALFSDESGLSDVFSWTEKAFHWLKSGGYYFMEFGDGQSEQVFEYFDKTHFFMEFSIHQDYSGLPRFVFAKK